MSQGVNSQPTSATAVAPQLTKVDGDAPKKEVKKPNKILPTVRIAFPKQLDALRGFAVASGMSSKLITLQEVANIVGLVPSTLSLGNPFWVDVNFLNRSEGQGFTVASELTEYAHAYDWNKETAAHKLAPALSKQWFWEVLEPRLRYSDLTEDEAITSLAERSSANPEYKPQLRMILEYLDAAGMIEKANGSVTRVRTSAASTPQPATTPVEDKPAAEPKKTVAGRSTVSTNFDQGSHGINFDISVKVDMAEFAEWQPARISAFFNGIAQVIAAKGAIEQDSTKE